MSLADNITGMKSPSPSKITLALRNSNVIESASQVKELNALLSPYNEVKAGIVNQMVIAMTSDQGNPNSVPDTMDAVEKQAIYDEAVTELKALKEAESPKKDPEPTNVKVDKPKSDSGSDSSDFLNALTKFFRGQIGPEILASVGITAVSTLFSKVDKRDEPTAEIARGTTEAVVREGEEVLPRTARAVGRGGKRILKWGLISAGILLFLPLILGPIGFIPLVIVLVGLAFAYSKAIDQLDKNKLRWLRKVGDELPVALRRTGVNFFDLADTDDVEAFNKVLIVLQTNLATKNPFDDAEEQQIDNLLVEMIARITRHYGDVPRAEAAIEDPKFSKFPDEVYDAPIDGKSQKTSFWV